MIERLSKELEREARTTRKHLERLPGDRLAWKPHEKSYSAGELASHLVDCIRWTGWICDQPELDLDPSSYVPFQASSVAGLLDAFDRDVAAAVSALKSVTEASLLEPWRFKVKGRLLFEKDREAVLRDFVLSHLIHHRGQLSVYLRLLEVPVPGSYGPTADEPF